MLTLSSGASRSRRLWAGVLARLLVFLMVPVVLVASADVARAADVRGPAKSVTINGFEGTIHNAVGEDGSCSITAQWVSSTSTSQNVRGSVNCSTGYNVSSMHVDLSFKGAGCSLNTWNSGELDGNGSANFATAAGQNTGCSITEVCATFKVKTHSNPIGDDTANETNCAAMDLGFPPETTKTYNCGGVSVTPATVGPLYRNPASGQGRFYRDVSMTVSNAMMGSKWGTYIVLSPYLATYENQRTTPLVGSVAVYHSGAVTAQGASTVITVPVPHTNISGATEPTVNVSIIGVGFYQVIPGQTDHSQGFNGVPVGMTTYAGPGAQAPMLRPTPGVIGITFEGLCARYWGTKLTNLDATDADDPLGPVPAPGAPDTPPSEPEAPPAEPPAPAGDSCDFSFTDPTSWATGGICALVKLLGAMIKAITALPLAIANAIGDLLKGLFVPSDGAFEDALADIKSAFDDTTPGNYMDAFESMAPSASASGCTGPSVTLPVGGSSKTFQPLNACSGGVSTLATMSRTILTAGFFLFGGLACVRAVGSGFGWSPKIGRGDGDA